MHMLLNLAKENTAYKLGFDFEMVGIEFGMLSNVGMKWIVFNA